MDTGNQNSIFPDDIIMLRYFTSKEFVFIAFDSILKLYFFLDDINYYFMMHIIIFFTNM